MVAADHTPEEPSVGQAGNLTRREEDRGRTSVPPSSNNAPKRGVLSARNHQSGQPDQSLGVTAERCKASSAVGGKFYACPSVARSSAPPAETMSQGTPIPRPKM